MDKFNFKHLFFIICSVTIASLKSYPEIIIWVSKRDSWICVIVASLLIIVYFDFIIRIYTNYRCTSLHDIFTLALGKVLGKIFLAIFAFMLFLSVIESASVETSIIHTNLFVESPKWYILLFILGPGLYTVVKGKNALMAVLIVCIFISICNGINLYVLTYPHRQFKWLFPIFEKGINLNFLIGIIKTLGLYASIAISLPYLSLISKTKKLRSCALVTSLFVAQMIIVSMNGILSTFTPERAARITYPKIIQTQLITYFGFIGSGEFYVIFQVISSWFAKYVCAFFALLIVLKELNIKKICNIKFLPYSITLVIYIMAYSVSSNLLVFLKFLNYYDYICIVGYIIMPFIVFTLYAIKAKRNNLQEQNQTN